MKLYHFNPHDYGQTFFVMAKSKIEALKFLKKSKEYGVKEYGFKKETVTIDSLPMDFTLDEIDEGIVIRSEIS